MLDKKDLDTVKGRFIVFEGVDNTGKTTISKIIVDWLKKEYNIDTIFTRHPGSTEVGKQLRQILKHSPHPINANAQALMFAADNSMFMHQILKPSLNEGKWVIGDRNNFISSMAYQISSGCSIHELDKVHNATLQTAKIDLLFIFKCGWEESRRRKIIDKNETSKPDRYEDAGKEYFNNLTKCYDRIISDHARLSKFVQFPIITINAEESISAVLTKVKYRIKEMLQPQSQEQKLP